MAVYISACGFERIDAGHVSIRVNQFGDDKGVDNVVEVLRLKAG